jgi:hypothetical protein
MSHANHQLTEIKNEFQDSRQKGDTPLLPTKSNIDAGHLINNDIGKTKNIMGKKTAVSSNKVLPNLQIYLREFETAAGVNIKAEVSDTKKCRSCLRHLDEEVKMFCFNSTHDGVELNELYKQYVGYNNPADEILLPAFICTDCHSRLLAFHEFRGKCRSNETIFLDLVKQTEILKEDTVLFSNEIIENLDYSDGNYVDEEQLMDFESESEEILETKVEDDELEIIYNPLDTTFKCNQCPKTYTKKLYVLNHFRAYHNLSEEDLKKINGKTRKVRNISQKRSSNH